MSHWHAGVNFLLALAALVPSVLAARFFGLLGIERVNGRFQAFRIFFWGLSVLYAWLALSDFLLLVNGISLAPMAWRSTIFRLGLAVMLWCLVWALRRRP